MKRFAHALPAVLVMAILAILLQGCESAEEAAAGTYTLDKESIKAEIQKEIDAQGPDANPMALAMAQQMIETMTMTITLNADGTASSSMTMMGQSQSTSGTWTLDGDAVAITLSEEGGEPSTARGKLDGETLEMESENSDVPFRMVFRRQAA